MATKPRPPLQEWQLEDAARLKALFAQLAKTTQDDFGQAAGIGGQSLVWQYVNGRIPLNLRVVVKFAEALGIDVADISPTLAAELPKPREVFNQFLAALPSPDQAQVIDFLKWKLDNALATRESDDTYRRWLAQLEQTTAAAGKK
jgi:transcriptional regulator with XRE-family HTH domain